MIRPLLLDPQAIPIEGVDDHLPAVPSRHLTPAALRLRFAVPGLFLPEFEGDGARIEGLSPAAASVLVPLVMRAHGLQVLLTRRTDHLRDHPGQISFPGGRAEPFDADAAATALREAHEEVGLAAAQVDVIGLLPTYTTVTNFVVTPVVALVRPEMNLALDTFEVAEAFEVPLAHLMDPAHHRHHRVESGEGTRRFMSIPWRPAEGPAPPREYFIWGATAAMLRNLYRFLSV